MKRFYKLVDIAREGEGYSIHLDGKPVKTPSGNILIAPTEGTATLGMVEWAGQGETIDPARMPFTQILVTTQEHVVSDRAEIERQIADYLNTDLLLYRTADPPTYARRQAEHWDPVVGWFNVKFQANLRTTIELSALEQDAQTHQLVQNYIQTLKPHALTILSITTAETGSILLGIAMLEQAFTPDQIFNAAQVEEQVKADIYNEELYGPAPHEEKQRALLRLSLDASQKFLEAL